MGTGGGCKRTREIDRGKSDVSTGMAMASLYGWAEPSLVMWQFVDAQVPPVRITMQQALEQYHADLMDEQAEIAAHQGSAIGRKRWKTKEGVYQLKDPEKLEQTSPNTDEATYAEMLRDV